MLRDIQLHYIIGCVIAAWSSIRMILEYERQQILRLSKKPHLTLPSETVIFLSFSDFFPTSIQNPKTPTHINLLINEQTRP